jgi:hypothetical protein
MNFPPRFALCFPPSAGERRNFRYVTLSVLKIDSLVVPHFFIEKTSFKEIFPPPNVKGEKKYFFSSPRRASAARAIGVAEEISSLK